MAPNSLLLLASAWPNTHATAAGVRTAALIYEWVQRYASTGSVCIATPNPVPGPAHPVHQLPARLAQVPLNNETAVRQLLAAVNPTVSVFDRYFVEEQFGHAVHRFAPSSVRILDTQDVHALRLARQAVVKQQRPDHKVAEDVVPSDAGDVWLRELTSMLRCDGVLLTSPHELQWLQLHVAGGLVPASKFMLASFKYPSTLINAQHPAFHERHDFMTIGNFAHAPNVDAVEFLRSAVWPRVRQQLPDAVMNVYGAGASAHHLQLSKPQIGFHVHGYCEDLATTMRAHRVLLAPIRFGAGLKGKVLDAWAHGLPVVTTSIGAEGLHYQPWGGLCADEAQLADAAVRLYTDHQLWQTSVQAARTHMVQHFSEHSHEWKELWGWLDDLQQHTAAARAADMSQQLLWQAGLRCTEYMAKWIEAKETNRLQTSSLSNTSGPR